MTLNCYLFIFRSVCPFLWTGVNCPKDNPGGKRNYEETVRAETLAGKKLGEDKGLQKLAHKFLRMTIFVICLKKITFSNRQSFILVGEIFHRLSFYFNFKVYISKFFFFFCNAKN